MLKASYDVSSNPQIKPLQSTIMYHDCMDRGGLLTINLSQNHMIICPFTWVPSPSHRYKGDPTLPA